MCGKVHASSTSTFTSQETEMIKAPIKVTQVGRLVMAEFSDNAGAVALKQELDDACLAQGNPVEFRRRYAAANGINEAGIQPE